MALPAPTRLTRRYLLDFSWRAAVFVMILGIYLYDKTLLNFTRQTTLFWPLSLLWVAVLVSMLAQLHPKSGLTTGCMKQYVSGFVPAASYNRAKLKAPVRQQNIGAAKAARPFAFAAELPILPFTVTPLRSERRKNRERRYRSREEASITRTRV